MKKRKKVEMEKDRNKERNESKEVVRKKIGIKEKEVWWRWNERRNGWKENNRKKKEEFVVLKKN